MSKRELKSLSAMAIANRGRGPEFAFSFPHVTEEKRSRVPPNRSTRPKAPRMGFERRPEQKLQKSLKKSLLQIKELQKEIGRRRYHLPRIYRKSTWRPYKKPSNISRQLNKTLKSIPLTDLNIELSEKKLERLKHDKVQSQKKRRATLANRNLEEFLATHSMRNT